MKDRLPPFQIKTVLMRGATSITPTIDEIPEAHFVVALLAGRIIDSMAAAKKEPHPEDRLVQRNARRFLEPGGEVELWADEIGLSGEFVRMVCEKSGHEWRQSSSLS